MINVRKKEDWDWIDIKITAKTLEGLINWGQQLNKIEELNSENYNILQIIRSIYYQHNLNKKK